MKKVIFCLVALATFFAVNAAYAVQPATKEITKAHQPPVIDLGLLDSHLRTTSPAITAPATPNFAGIDLSAVFKK